jgi:hypothetical protein
MRVQYKREVPLPESRSFTGTVYTADKPEPTFRTVTVYPHPLSHRLVLSIGTPEGELQKQIAQGLLKQAVMRL